MERERNAEIFALMQKGQFGGAMLLDRPPDEVGRIPAFMFVYDRHTDVVFVRTAEEAAGFPDDVMVGWPGERTEQRLVAFNDVIDSEIAMAAAGIVEFEGVPEALTLPITKEDLVEHSEAVVELFFRIPDARGSIERYLRRLQED